MLTTSRSGAFCAATGGARSKTAKTAGRKCPVTGLQELQEEIATIHANHHQSVKELRESHAKEIQELSDHIENESKGKEESLQLKLNEVFNEISAKNIEVDELHQKIKYYDEQLQVNITSYISHYLIY